MRYVWVGGQLNNPVGIVVGSIAILLLIGLYFALLYLGDAIDAVRGLRR